MAQKFWGGRFTKRSDPRFDRFGASLRWDKRLLPYDLAIDRVHARELRACGVLSPAEESRFLRAIEALEADALSGRYRLADEGHEDVHSAIQSELKRRLGELADKIHTGRSRNDLVSQSSRLYCKEHAGVLAALVRGLQAAFVAQADRARDLLLPGMTHLQNAQVLSQAHIYLSYVEMLERAKKRFLAARQTADVCVLGSGALAGTTFSLDQARMARRLGLSSVTSNSYDVSGDRDFVLELVSAAAFCGITLSRISEDLMIGQTKPYSLVDVDQAFCTGSSMMPQKKNADFLELTRGAAGVLAGNLTGLMMTLKGLPSSYNRDLQWDKGHLFVSVETAEEVLAIFADLAATLKIDGSRAKALLADESLYATDLADYLVRKGAPFKQAHEQVGRIVTFAEEVGKPISKIGLDLLRGFAPRVEGDVYALFDAAHSAALKRTQGSTHPARVAAQIARWKRALSVKK